MSSFTSLGEIIYVLGDGAPFREQATYAWACKSPLDRAYWDAKGEEVAAEIEKFQGAEYKVLVADLKAEIADLKNEIRCLEEELDSE